MKPTHIKIKVISLIFGLLSIFFILSPAVLAATGDFKTDYDKSGAEASIRKYLCAPEQDTLFGCINKFYKFSIAIGAVVGVFFIVIAGYIYMSAEGDNEAVSKAKSILVSTITAMVILMGGYVLLNALNPDITKFKTIQPPDIAKEVEAGVLETAIRCINGTCTDGRKATDIQREGKQVANCANCVDFSSVLPQNGTLKPGTNTFLDASLLSKLQKINSVYTSWRVNEAFPPTVTHSDPCHYNGTCADIGVTSKTSGEVDRLCKAIKDSGSGLNITNEYYEFSASGMPNCPAPAKYANTTSGHLHVK